MLGFYCCLAHIIWFTFSYFCVSNVFVFWVFFFFLSLSLSRCWKKEKSGFKFHACGKCARSILFCFSSNGRNKTKKKEPSRWVWFNQPKGVAVACKFLLVFSSSCLRVPYQLDKYRKVKIPFWKFRWFPLKIFKMSKFHIIDISNLGSSLFFILPGSNFYFWLITRGGEREEKILKGKRERKKKKKKKKKQKINYKKFIFFYLSLKKKIFLLCHVPVHRMKLIKVYSRKTWLWANENAPYRFLYLVRDSRDSRTWIII